MTVNIKLIQRDGVEASPMPVKGSEEAACYDVRVSKIEHIASNLVKVYLGIATDLPKWYKGVVVPRSSFTQKGWVMQNSPAQIDSDYRGEWMIKFEAIPTDAGTSSDGQLVDLLYEDFPYKVGDRCAQIYFEEVLPIGFNIVTELGDTARGEGGFGSTGQK